MSQTSRTTYEVISVFKNYFNIAKVKKQKADNHLKVQKCNH